MKVNVSECSDLGSIIELFDIHRDEPFIYSADTQLLRLFSRLESCKILEAKVHGTTVGCIYAMKYMYNYGWLGGLLVHKEFRRKGIGKRLLEKALALFDTRYTYAFVEPENMAARKLFESAGFNALYRRLSCRVEASFAGLRSEDESIDREFQWDEPAEAAGFKERGGVVNLGYYPIKLAKDVFDDLKNEGRVLRLGDLMAIVGNSYVVGLDRYAFIFNEHILKRVSLPIKEEIIEVNPFYTKHDTRDLVKLLKNLTCKEVVIWTYDEDPVASRLPLRKSLGALVLELYKNV